MKTRASRLRPNGTRRSGHRPARRRQRGAIAIVAAIAVAMAIAALGVVDVANLYLTRRAVQNVADLAALAAVQQMDDTCTQPHALALANAANNDFVPSSTQTISVQCGRWDAGNWSVADASTPTPLNGVQVTVMRQVPYLFLGLFGRTNPLPAQVSASATAKAAVVDSFSLATTLATVSSAQSILLNTLFNSLFGPNSNVDLSAVSWSGIANANVTLAELAAGANVGSVDALLQSKLTVSQLATAMATALQNNGASQADASVAGLTALAAANASNREAVAVGSASGSGIISTTSTPNNDQSIPSLSLNALQALLVAAEIAQSGQQPYGAQLNLSSLPLTSGTGLLATATVAVNVISPPSLSAMGEAGAITMGPPPQWRTYAQNAQTTVSLNVGLSAGSFLSVNLPLYVEAAPAFAWLESAQCVPPSGTSSPTSVTEHSADVVTIGVTNGLANLCLGTPPTTAAEFASNSCGGTSGAIATIKGNALATLLNTNPLLAALGLGTILSDLGLSSNETVQLNANLSVPITNPTSSPTYLQFDGNGCPSGSTATCPPPQSVSVGTGVAGALGNALSSVSSELGNGAFTVTANGGSVSLTSSELGTLAGSVVGILTPTVFTTLDTDVLGPLLQLLGVQLGVATITDYPLSCGVAQLVR